jgi:2-alkyl-3-oxoalkanoate reductase
VAGDGRGKWSFIHVEDAAAATAAAVERGRPGIYNIVDDEPVAAGVWIPELARVLDAEPPLHVPPAVARREVGESGLYMHNRVRGLSNAKARRELGWRPRYPGYREGFRTGLGAPAAVAQ